MQIEAGLSTPATIRGRRSARQRHEPHATAESGSDGPRNLESVECGRPEIDQRNDRRIGERGVEAAAAILGDRDIVPLILQQQPEHVTAILVVLDDEDARVRAGAALWGGGPPDPGLGRVER